jgi:beta-glucosidase
LSRISLLFLQAGLIFNLMMVHFVFIALCVALASAARAEAQPRPWLNWTLPTAERVKALVGAMRLEEKCAQLVRDTPRIERLGLPAYNWRNNVLHGTVENGISTIFPMPIGLAASFDVDLLAKSAGVWAEEQRAAHNIKMGEEGLKDCPMNFGLNLWGPNINLFSVSSWLGGNQNGKDHDCESIPSLKIVLVRLARCHSDLLLLPKSQ